jgi:hypothetical protein
MSIKRVHLTVRPVTALASGGPSQRPDLPHPWPWSRLRCSLLPYTWSWSGQSRRRWAWVAPDRPAGDAQR